MEDEPSKGTERNVWAELVVVVLEVHLEIREVVHDGGADTGDDEEDGGAEEQKAANVVEEACLTHFGDVVVSTTISLLLSWISISQD